MLIASPVPSVLMACAGGNHRRSPSTRPSRGSGDHRRAGVAACSGTRPRRAPGSPLLPAARAGLRARAAPCGSIALPAARRGSTCSLRIRRGPRRAAALPMAQFGYQPAFCRPRWRDARFGGAFGAPEQRSDRGGTAVWRLVTAAGRPCARIRH
eukprot:5591695-Prymnesium_polylepis.1